MTRLSELSDHYKLTQLVEGNPVATFVIDADHVITHWNRACELLTGASASEMIGTREHWRPFYPNPRPVMADLLVNGALDGDVDRFYRGKFRASGTIDGAFEAEDFFPHFGERGRWLFFTAAALRDFDGRVIGAIETLQDVSKRREAEAAVREKEAFLTQVVEGSPVATLVINNDHQVTHWNHACEMLTGVRKEEIIGTRDQWRAFYPAERPIMADLVLTGAREQEVDVHYHGKFWPSALVEGGVEAEDFFPHFGARGRWLYFTAAPLRGSRGELIGAIETLQDVTERREAEEALRESEDRFRRLSVTDALTGLFNSRHFYERIQAEIERAARYRRPLSLLVIDADNFKSVNDTHGHLQGDRVLQKLAEVITHCLRRTDSAYRYGGEEFVLVLPEAPLEAAIVLGERLRKAFSEVVHVVEAGVEFRCTVSVGVAEFINGEDRQQFVKRADDASYQAKRQGKNCVVAAPRPV